MSEIIAAIEIFNQIEGVSGALVCTHDGMLIEGKIGERFDRDVVSALVSSVGLVLKNSCESLKMKGYSQYRMAASKGDMVIFDLGTSLFVVMLEKGANMGNINAEIFQTANRIKKSISMG